MAKNDKSPLVESVLALDEQFAELERVGQKIMTMPMKTESEITQMRRMMGHFAEYGQGVSNHIQALASRLGEARVKAEAIATQVGKRADELEALNTDHNQIWERFRALNEKVTALNHAISALRKPEGESYSDDEKRQLSQSLASFDSQFDPLIEESQGLRKEAHAHNMKTLESNADSLAQSLQAVRQKIRVLNPTSASH